MIKMNSNNDDKNIGITAIYNNYYRYQYNNI